MRQETGFLRRLGPLVTGACAGLALAALVAVPTASALTTAEIAKLAGPDRQKLLEEGARKEGALTLYSSLIVDQMLRPLGDAFTKKYPYIKLDYWRGEARQIIQKLLAETRANSPIGDVVETTSIEPPLIEAGVLQSFASPETDVLPPEYRDPAGFAAPTRCNYYGGAYNTKLVPAASVPKTYEDLLDPKWKGKIAWPVDTDSGASLFLSNLSLAWGEEKGLAYAKKFAAQKPISFSSSARNLVNRVMEGEYPIAVAIQLQHPLISGHAGASVAPLPMDPVAVMCSTAMLVKATKHPYASMLLIDFLIGKDGQEVFRDHEYLTVNPKVPPLEAMQPIVPHLQGFKENVIKPAAMYAEGEKSDAILNQYFQ